MRFARALLTVWLVVTLVFFGIRVSGDPARMFMGDQATPEELADYREAMGLDDSQFTQYRRYVSSLLRGDFGHGVSDHRPVTTIIGSVLPATLELMFISLAIVIGVGLLFGIFAALRQDGLFDRGMRLFTVLGHSVPGFVVGIALIFAFSVGLRWLPSSGKGGVDHLILPIATMAWGGLAGMSRIVRSSVIDALHQDHVRTARAKGLTEQNVITSHVLRNAAIPVATLIGFMLSGVIAGSIIIETVFAWPGMGRLISAAVTSRDYPVLQCSVFLITGSVVTVNFLVDIAYGILDPRIRLRGQG
jgi:peptide/nickel transport system permease protein